MVTPDLDRSLHRCLDPPLVIFAVRDHDDDPLLDRRIGERVEGEFERGPEVCALNRGQFRVHRVEKEPRGPVVGGQGTLDERLAGEGDETDAVPVQPLDQALDLELGALQAVGGDVLRQHRRGQVERHDDVHAFAADGLHS